MTTLKFTVTVELTRLSGKFVSKDALADEVRDAIESADPGSVMVDDSEYEVASFAVEETAEEPKEPVRALKMLSMVCDALDAFTDNEPEQHVDERKLIARARKMIAGGKP